MPTFIIHRIEYGRDDIAVIGRCGDEPIPLGTVFRCAYRRTANWNEGAVTMGPPVSRREIDSKVIAIDAYGRDLEYLDRGMSGRLRLIGEGRDSVESDYVLSTEVYSDCRES